MTAFADDEGSDLSRWLISEITDAREDIARRIDRLEALEELAGVVADAEARHGPLSPADLVDIARDTYERFKLQTLLDRATQGDT